MDFLVPQDDAAREHRRQVLERAMTDPGVHPQVDSGRLAEPYWYPESPLVTPDPTRSPPVRPPKGEYPLPAPGVIVPDFPVMVPGRPRSPASGSSPGRACSRSSPALTTRDVGTAR